MSEATEYFWTKKTATGTQIGLTAAGQAELGTISFAKLPSVGDHVTMGANLLSVEADKAVSDIESPVSGTVTAVNPALDDDFAVLNANDPAAAWFVTVRED